MTKNFALPLALSCAGIIGCSKHEVATRTETTPPPEVRRSESPAPALDACSMLTGDEIASVQGQPLKDTKKREAAEGGFFISQCYFALPSMGDSVELRVVRRGAGEDARDPRQVWNESFAPEKFPEEEKGEREGSGAPERISGVGDEAYWRGNPKSGALYVLKGNAYIRVGMIDIRDKDAAVKKCSALAAMVLQRL